QRAKDHRRIYQKFYIEDLFPKITNRYQEKHGEAFPMSVQAKVDHLQKNVNEIMVKLDAILKQVGGEFQHRVSRVFQVMPHRCKLQEIYRRLRFPTIRLFDRK
ncbi:unnamed protein product, partial [Porites evermanni]